MKQLTLLLLSILLLQCSAQQPEWEKVFLSDAMRQVYSVSSELDEVNPFEGLGAYGGHNLFDKDNSTAWVEGVQGSGINEYVILGIGSEFPEQMVLLNGYQKNKDLFSKNNRVKTIRISLFTGFMIPMDMTEIGVYYRIRQFDTSMAIELEDRYGSQQIPLPWERDNVDQVMVENRNFFLKDFEKELAEAREDCPSCPTDPKFRFFLKIEILDIYKGSQWDDTCISDIWFTSPDKKAMTIPTDEQITEVWEDFDEGMIYVNTNKQEGIVLADGKALEKARNLDEDEHMDITLMDVSPDKEWAQVDYLYTQDGAGRVEEYSTLYSVRYLTMIDEPILGIIYGAFGFIEEKGKIYLDTADGPLDLDKILEEFLKNK